MVTRSLYGSLGQRHVSCTVVTHRSAREALTAVVQTAVVQPAAVTVLELVMAAAVVVTAAAAAARAEPAPAVAATSTCTRDRAIR